MGYSHRSFRHRWEFRRHITYLQPIQLRLAGLLVDFHDGGQRCVLCPLISPGGRGKHIPQTLAVDRTNLLHPIQRRLEGASLILYAAAGRTGKSGNGLWYSVPSDRQHKIAVVWCQMLT